MPGITTTTLGRVVPLFKGLYDSAATYTKLDVVTDGGSSYILVDNSAKGQPPAGGFPWQKIAEKGGQGDPGAQGPAGKIVGTETAFQMLAPGSTGYFTATNVSGDQANARLKFELGIPYIHEPVYRGPFDINENYSKFDNVLSGGSTYISLIDNNTGHQPSSSPDEWRLIASQGNRGPQGNVTPLGQVTATAAAASSAGVNVNQTGNYGENIAFSFNLPAGPIGFDTVSAEAVSIGSTSQPDVVPTITTVEGNRNLNLKFYIPAAVGTGVASVDSIGASADYNIDLKAIRYTQQNLSDGAKIIARENIGAVEDPTDKDYGAFLRYGGNVESPGWVAEQISQVPNGGVSGYVLRKQTNGYGWTPVYEVPSGGTTGSILTKNSNTSYDLTWTGNITNADIDTIMSE